MPCLRPGRALALLLFLLPLLVLVGCGKSKNGSVTVKGIVSYKGAPLPGGSIRFVDAKDKSNHNTTVIRGDGTYELIKAPLGDVKVAVIGPTRSSTDHDPKSKPSLVLPKDYEDPDKSGLTYTVTSDATQEKNFDLK